MPIEQQKQPDNIDKAKEFLKSKFAGLSQAAADKLEEMKALVDNEAAKEVVYKNQGNPDYAGLAAKTTKETRDPKPLDQFLRATDASTALKITPENQVALLEATKTARALNFDSLQTKPRDFDEASNTYELVARLPEAKKQMVKEYQDGLAKGMYKDQIPAQVAGLPRDLQQTIHDGNPDAFANSFPSSELMKGPELQNLVAQDIESGFGGTAMRARMSLSGRKNSVLNNPNLNSQQVNDLAAAFLKIGYDGKPERNPDYFQATEAVSSVFMKFYRNANLSATNKSALIERFGKQVGVTA